ncbi:MAG: undecaprenyl-phosphate glucose phosphotransferase [Cellvibrionales bacterium]|nr:undecaprenyl-phosphate glucose phosphotransferase [Cellvibrionales bacterium]
MTQTGFIRSHQWLVSLCQRLLDQGIIFFALMLAILFRDLPVNLGDRGYLLAAILAGSCFYVFAIHLKLYQSYRTVSLATPVGVLLQIWFLTVVTLVMLSFALKSTAYFSRIVMGSWLIITPSLMILSRLIVRECLKRLRVDGRNSRKLVVVGWSERAALLIDEINRNPWMGYTVEGCFDDKPPETEVTYLGGLETLVDKARNNTYDAIYIALPMESSEAIRSLIKKLSNSSTPVYYLPDLFVSHLMGGKISYVGDMPAVSIYSHPYEAGGAIVKRLEDVVLSSLILFLISPLMLIIALLIKLTSKGPVIFKQQRYGLAGESIQVYKFRTMVVHQDKQVAQATRDDTRITPLGRFLRKTSLDELPQFINVLQGRMSVVGPRPHAIVHNEYYREAIEGYMLRHLVKPGITGWAQVNGWRGETDTLDKMQHRIDYDLYYLNHWSVSFDIKIILMTIFKGFAGKNVY